MWALWRSIQCFFRLYFAQNIFEEIAKCGPLYVKLSQWIAQRPDIIGKDMSDKLMDLQTKVPEHDWEHTVKALEESFGAKRAWGLLRQCEPFPMASGSIAQVYRAVIDSTPVIVKVRHPFVLEKIDENIEELRYILWILQLFPRFSFLKVINVYEIAKELKGQCCLQNEIVHMETFRKNFGEEHPYISFPRPLPHWNYPDNDKVLVETFVEGDHFHNMDPNHQQVCKHIAIAAYFKMVLHDGYFHGDIHNGNLIYRTNGEKKIHLSFVDFGTVIRLDSLQREAICALIVGMYRGDIDTTLSAFNVLLEKKARSDFTEACTRALYDFEEKRKRDGAVKLSVLIMQILNLLQKYDIVMNMNVIRVLVGMIVLEQGRPFANAEKNWTGSSETKGVDNAIDNALRWVLFEVSEDAFSLENIIVQIIHAIHAREQGMGRSPTPIMQRKRRKIKNQK